MRLETSLCCLATIAALAACGRPKTATLRERAPHGEGIAQNAGSTQGDPPPSELNAQGNVVGNGGDALVCRTQAGDIVSAEALDIYEARVLRGLAPALGDPAQPAPARAARAFERLRRLDP